MNETISRSTPRRDSNIRVEQENCHGIEEVNLNVVAEPELMIVNPAPYPYWQPQTYTGCDYPMANSKENKLPPVTPAMA